MAEEHEPLLQPLPDASPPVGSQIGEPEIELPESSVPALAASAAQTVASSKNAVKVALTELQLQEQQELMPLEERDELLADDYTTLPHLKYGFSSLAKPALYSL